MANFISTDAIEISRHINLAGCHFWSYSLFLRFHNWCWRRVIDIKIWLIRGVRDNNHVAAMSFLTFRFICCLLGTLSLMSRMLAGCKTVWWNNDSRIRLSLVLSQEILIQLKSIIFTRWSFKNSFLLNSILILIPVCRIARGMFEVFKTSFESIQEKICFLVFLREC